MGNCHQLLFTGEMALSFRMYARAHLFHSVALPTTHREMLSRPDDLVMPRKWNNANQNSFMAGKKNHFWTSKSFLPWGSQNRPQDLRCSLTAAWYRESPRSLRKSPVHMAQLKLKDCVCPQPYTSAKHKQKGEDHQLLWTSCWGSPCVSAEPGPGSPSGPLQLLNTALLHQLNSLSCLLKPQELLKKSNQHHNGDGKMVIMAWGVRVFSSRMAPAEPGSHFCSPRPKQSLM